MRELQPAVQNNHLAVTEFLTAARAVAPAAWSVPRAEGKWSPAQVAEHLVKTYEFSERMITGKVAEMAGPPKLLRPLVRLIVRATILRTGRFMKAKAPAPFQPSLSPPAQDVLCARLQGASDAFEREARNAYRSGRTTFEHPFFGPFGLADYAQLQAYHAVHHRAQLGVAGR